MNIVGLGQRVQIFVERVRSGVVRALMGRGAVVPEAAGHLTARDMMIAPATTVTVDTPIGEATRRMVARQHRALPVVDQAGRLVGIVDRAHLLGACHAAGSTRSA